MKQIIKLILEYYKNGNADVMYGIWMYCSGMNEQATKEVKAFGDNKYGYESWRMMSWGDTEKRAYCNAMLRHCYKVRGNILRTDKESKFAHIGHIGINAFIIYHMHSTTSAVSVVKKDTKNKKDILAGLGL